MKTILFLSLLFIFTACNEEKVEIKELTNKSASDYVKIIKEKNFSLTQNDSLKYFFYTEGIDKEINEPYSEIESGYAYSLQGSQNSLINFENFEKSNILAITDNYLLTLINVDSDFEPLAATFKLDGTPINFLLLEDSFGTNEFSIKRRFKRVKESIFTLSDERYDVEWIIHPTKGINKLTHRRDVNITVDKKGFFSKFNDSISTSFV